MTVITKDEASQVGDALASVQWADEIIVVDSESQDTTVDIARTYTDRVVVRRWEGYVSQKNYAASLATHDWILSVDADERVTPELATEIRSILSGPSHQGYPECLADPSAPAAPSHQGSLASQHPNRPRRRAR